MKRRILLLTLLTLGTSAWADTQDCILASDALDGVSDEQLTTCMHLIDALTKLTIPDSQEHEHVQKLIVQLHNLCSNNNQTRGSFRKVLVNLLVENQAIIRNLTVLDTATFIGLLTAGNAHFTGNVIIDGKLIVNGTGVNGAGPQGATGPTGPQGLPGTGLIFAGNQYEIARYTGTDSASIEPSLVTLSDLQTTPQSFIQIAVQPTNTSLVLSPSGTGSLIADAPDSTAVGGNARGNNAVDWQMSRTDATQVASGNFSVISGGENNTGAGNFSVISGGENNSIGSTSTAAIIGGGSSNIISSGTEAFIGGGLSNSITGTNAGPTTYSSIVGGISNSIFEAVGAFIGGGNNNTITTPANTGAICGGRGNIITAQSAFIGGGVSNTGSGNHATVGGGLGNTAGSTDSFVGGGNSNLASGTTSVVCGGQTNQATNTQSFVGGGANNTGSGSQSFVGGGANNVASGTNATVVGGSANTGAGNFSFLGGGESNQIISGAPFATLCGGQNNGVNGNSAFVGGGSNNTGSGANSMILGGNNNFASGNAACALGAGAVANTNNTFVWSDGTITTGIGAGTFTVFATNGTYLLPLQPTATNTALGITAGGKIVLATSSREHKENIKDLPDSNWIYKLEGKQFNYKNCNDVSFGWIAEDVAEIKNELVVYKDDKPFSLPHHQFLPFMVEELKKHEQRLQALEAR